MAIFDCRILIRFYGDDKTKLHTSELFHGKTTAKTKEEACNNIWYRAAIKRGIDPKKHPRAYNRFRDNYKDYKCECNEIEPNGQELMTFEDMTPENIAKLITED